MSIWLGAASVMFIHHAVQQRSPAIPDQPCPTTKRQRLTRFVYRGAFPSFLIALLTWSILNQLRVLTYDGDNPRAIHSTIIAVQQPVAMAAVVLFVLAVAVSLDSLLVRLRNSDARGKL